MLSKPVKEAQAEVPWPDFCEIQHHLGLARLEWSNNHPLACYFYNVFLCLNLLSCVSTAAEPVFARRLRDQLQDENITTCIEKVLGCHQIVLKYILDIAELQHWKEVNVTQGTMSLIEQVKRAIPIETGLREVQLLASGSETARTQSMPLSRQVSTVTKVMACAAGVYLYGTLCGLQAGVPELTNAVADTIAAIKLVPNAEVIKGLSWSATIAALASSEEDHRNFFRELARGMLEQYGKCEIFRTLNVAFEFWARRDSAITEKKEYSWKDALCHEGIVTFLFL